MTVLIPPSDKYKPDVMFLFLEIQRRIISFAYQLMNNIVYKEATPFLKQIILPVFPIVST